MNETTTWACKFRDSQGQLRSINIHSLADDLSSETIANFMPYVLASNVLVINQG